MANLQAITKTEFAKKSWQRSPNFLFCAKDAVCPLSAPELPSAMMAMPLAFVCTDGEYSLVAVQGLQPGENFFVSAQGKWLGGYVPAAYRGYPFVLATNSTDEAEEGELVLCINTDSGLLIEDDSSEPFFDEHGEIDHTVKELMDFLSNIRAGHKTSTLICKSLSEHDLLKPWDLHVELDDGTRRIDGLFCIDETALNALSDAAFGELRQTGAVPLIYSQLLSMQRITGLKKIAQARSKASLAPQSSELNLDGDSIDGNISFDNL